MKKQRPKKGGLLLSIAIHALLLVALGAITFRYPLGELMGLARRDETPERLQYIALPRGPVGNGAGAPSKTAPARSRTPAPLRAPTEVPTAVPVTPQPKATEGAISGKEGGVGGAAAGAATGIEPASPDPRLKLSPSPFQPVPKTPAEKVDSAVKAAFGIYYDSAVYAAEHPERKPGDWTITRGGQKYGWDPDGIHVGKFTIPNAVLAVLPLKVGSGRSPIEARNQSWMSRDIAEHAQQSISEDEFRDAVRRIRERKERERHEKDKAVVADGKGKDADPPRQP
jgi:hypothetical protein